MSFNIFWIDSTTTSAIVLCGWYSFTAFYSKKMVFIKNKNVEIDFCCVKMVEYRGICKANNTSYRFISGFPKLFLTTPFKEI